MLRRPFRRWLARLPYFDVGDGRGDVFFRRYDVLKTRLGSVYLHEFFRSDKDRCTHDHAWSFLTIILRGGYWEEVVTRTAVMAIPGRPYAQAEQVVGKGRYWRRPGYIGLYRAEHAHRIELDPDPARPKPWSLVLVGPKRRAWGFWGPHGWVPWVKGQGNPICETPAGQGAGS